MFEDFVRAEIKTSGARVVAVRGGTGPPLLLLHGNPFSHLSWHKIAALRSRSPWWRRTCAATGDSEKPPGGADHGAIRSASWRRTRVEVMAAFGFERFYAAAMIAAPACPPHVSRPAAKSSTRRHLDIIPQHHLLNNVTRQWGTSPGIGSS